MVKVQDDEFPDRLFYDMENQIWYEPLGDGTTRAGFTAWAVTFMGEVLVFTPKRIGRDFEKGKSFAVVEGGKWVGSARAAFAGVVIAHNESLVKSPELLNHDAYGQGWMLIVRPTDAGWQDGLITGSEIAPTFETWLASGAYQHRTE